jgi:RNA polymerase sigma-70 factor (ECF subfamily)
VQREARNSAGTGVGASQIESLSDEQLAARIAEGCEQSFQALMTRHVNMHLAFAERIMGNRAEAEDVVQDAFAKLWLNAHKFDASKSKFTTWFYRVVMNRCLDIKRKKKPVALPEGYEKEDRKADLDRNMGKLERLKMIQGALEEIPDRQKAAITLCYFEELSNKEAAEVLGVNIKALESLLTRGRRNLEGLLKNVLKM